MPQDAKPKDGWTVERGQELAPSEVEPFLSWLFSDLAQKPQEMTLRETASVVRYLISLSLHGVPKEVLQQGPEAINKYRRGPKTEETIRSRQDVERAAMIVWGDLLQVGQFGVANGREAQEFFLRHRSAWNHPWLSPALKFLKDFELPADAPSPFRQYSFVAESSAASSGANAYLENDLSERIAAADSALRRTRVKQPHALIATALQKSLRTRELRPKNDLWGPIEVRDRVKGYKKQKQAHPIDGLADKWILSYRWFLKIEEMISTWKASANNSAV
jgi:hypothetical protein